MLYREKRLSPAPKREDLGDSDKDALNRFEYVLGD